MRLRKNPADFNDVEFCRFANGAEIHEFFYQTSSLNH